MLILTHDSGGSARDHSPGTACASILHGTAGNSPESICQAAESRETLEDRPPEDPYLVAPAMIRLKEACDIWSQRYDTFEIIENLVAQASRARPFTRFSPLAERGHGNAEDRGGGFRADEVTTLGCQLRHHIFYAHATPLAIRHIQRSTGPLPAA
jgi:hypothetical protein